MSREYPEAFAKQSKCEEVKSLFNESKLDKAIDKLTDTKLKLISLSMLKTIADNDDLVSLTPNGLLHVYDAKFSRILVDNDGPDNIIRNRAIANPHNENTKKAGYFNIYDLAVSNHKGNFLFILLKRTEDKKLFINENLALRIIKGEADNKYFEENTPDIVYTEHVTQTTFTVENLSELFPDDTALRAISKISSMANNRMEQINTVLGSYTQYQLMMYETTDSYRHLRGLSRINLLIRLSS